MKIKNKILAILANNGGGEMLIRGLDLKDEYKAINFRKAINKAIETLIDSEKEYLKQCNLTAGDNGKLIGSDDDIKRFRELRAEYHKDESEIECKAISFNSWAKLKQDNIVLAVREVEEALEGGFWTAPAEEENNS